MVERETNIYLNGEAQRVTVQCWPNGWMAVEFGYLVGIGISLGIATVASVSALILRAVS